MAIELPRAGAGSVGTGGVRRRGTKLPDAGDVPRQEVASDPGIPSSAFKGLAAATKAEFTAFGEFAGSIDDLGDFFRQQQKRADATATTEGEVAFDGKTAELLRRSQTEDDLSHPDFLKDFESRLGLGDKGGGLIAEAMANLSGDTLPEARENHRLELLKRARRIASRAGGLALLAQKQRAADSVNAAANVMAAQAENDPDALPGILDETDRVIAKFATTMTADAERDARTLTRQQNIEAAARGFTTQGRFKEAEALLATYAADLDPEGRARIRAVIDRAEKRLDVVTRRKVADAVAVLDFGKIPPDILTVEALADGTVYAPVLKAAIEDRQKAREFVQSPVAEQARELKSFDAKKTATRRQIELQKRLARSHASIVTAANQGHGLAMAAQAGVIEEPVTLEFDDPASLRLRAAQADVAGQWLGRPVSPLSPAEADGLVEVLDKATPSMVTGLLRGLVDGFGQDQAIALAGEIADKRPELAVAITLAGDVPILAREIVVGGRLARKTPDVLPGKTDRVSVVGEVIGNLFTPETAGVLDSFMDAAGALYAARKVPTGDLTFDDDVFEQALRDVMGGPIEYNKRVILPPIPGMSEDAFEDLVERLTVADLLQFGNGAPVFEDGTAFEIAMFDRGFFAKDAQFVTSGFGKYMIFMPGLGFALADGGGTYEIDLRRFSE